MTNSTGVLSSSVAIEIATVSKPMCLLSGSVVAAKGVALNSTVAADVMDVGERISALLLLSVDFSCLTLFHLISFLLISSLKLTLPH
jgi:hypothetical protein